MPIPDPLLDGLYLLIQFVALVLPAWLAVLVLPSRFTAGRKFPLIVIFLSAILLLNSLASYLLDTYSLWPALTFQLFFVLLALLASLTLKVLRQRTAGGSDQSGDEVGAEFFWKAVGGSAIPFALLGSALLLALVMNLRTPPAGWDALTYHLEFPLAWLKAGKLFAVPTGYGDYSPTYYPLFASLWYGWFLLPGRGPLLADVMQLFWLIVLWDALRRIARLQLTALPENEREKPRSSLELLAVVGATAPYLLSSILHAENDTILAAWFALALFFNFDSKRAGAANEANNGGFFRDYLPVLLFGAASGFLIGVKYSGVVYLAALLFYSLVIDRTVDSRRKNVWESLKTRSLKALLFSVSFLPTGGFWYLRNLIWTGNPFYPGEIRLFGFKMFSGFYTSSFLTGHPFHRFSFGDFFSDPGYLVVLFLFLFLLSAVLLLSFLRRKQIGRPGPEWRIVLLPPIVFLFFYLFIPLRHHRLLTPLVPALVVAMNFLIVHLFVLGRGGYAKSLGFFLGGAIAAQLFLFAVRLAELYGSIFHPRLSLTDFSRGTLLHFLNKPIQSLAYLPALALLAAILWSVFHLFSRHRGHRHNLWRLAVAIVGFLLISFFSATQTMSAYNGRAGELGRVWSWLERNRPAEESIGVIGTNALTGFRGLRAGRRVWLIDSRPGGDRILHRRFGESMSDESEARRYELKVPHVESLFRRRLNQNSISLVFVKTKTGIIPPEWPPERKWLQQARPDGRSRWRRIFAEGNMEIYQRKFENREIQKRGRPD